jgi:rubrerythrin
MDQPPFYFRACEIAELASKLEEAGEAFYARFASRTKGKTGEIISFLAAQEALHKKRFQALARSDESRSEQEYSVDLRSHIAGLIDTIRREAMPQKGTVPVDLPQALTVAYRLEKESIKVYDAICASFTGEFKHILSTILLEEKAHLDMIEGLMKER